MTGGGVEAGRVLVTGGARGIGAAIVRELAARGHAVDFTYHASAEAAGELAAELGAAHPQAPVSALRCDLGDRAAVEEFAQTLEAAEAGYYGFVHNAGRSYDSLAAMIDVDRAAAAMEVNLWAMVRLVSALMRPMRAARAGRVVAIGSATALRGNQGNAAYAASKAAIQGYCATLAVESAARGITVNTIAPGFIDTEMLAPYEDHREGLEKQIPAGRYGRPEEIAAMVGFLMSEGASYVTGAVLAVDGGLAASLGVKR